jgi:hypothetical protein
MLDHAIHVYAFMLDYARLLTDDLDDRTMCDQPFPGMNPPAWVLGHLAVCTDFALMLLGREKLCPPEWHAMFGPGSTLAADRSAYPSKEELMSALERGHEAVTAALPIVTPELLAAKHPFPVRFLRRSLPSVGDLLLHLLTSHEAVHLGQLSAWRRSVGLGGVLQL